MAASMVDQMVNPQLPFLLGLMRSRGHHTQAYGLVGCAVR